MTDSTKPVGVVNRALPGIFQDNTQNPMRLSRRGELFVNLMGSAEHAMADQGCYFVAHNATNDASTTLAGHAAPVLADADATLVKPFIHLSMPASATARAYLKSIEIEVVTAGANGTQACWAAQLDTSSRGITTPGTALTTVNCNMQSTAAPSLAPTGGAIVVPVETSLCRNLGFGTLRPSIEIAGDIKMFVFGGGSMAAAAAGTQAGQAAASIRTSVVNLPPVILGAGDVFLLALHSQASQTVAGVYKVRMDWWEV
jgi:hypothetical protein